MQECGLGIVGLWGELRCWKVFGFDDPVRSSWTKVFPVKKLLNIMAGWKHFGKQQDALKTVKLMMWFLALV